MISCGRCSDEITEANETSTIVGGREICDACLWELDAMIDEEKAALISEKHLIERM